ncbi:hypothetical protein DFH06DRAFT_1437737 [Mycena polygramma]|nr:hypothetical protein DFH06DRAFT_1437737 [Mycena polygramma]
MAAHTQNKLSPLPDFIHEAFVGAVISPDDATSAATLTKFWAPDVQESDVATSSHISLAGFRQVVNTIRTTFTERKFVTETFLIATPADPTNKSGAAAAKHVFTALQDGKPVTVTIVAVLRINWVQEHSHPDGGHREVVTEAFINSTGKLDHIYAL